MKKERKTVMFRIMITPSEKQWIEDKSKETGLTQSQVVRFHYMNNVKETEGKFKNTEYEDISTRRT
jgi:hypothetical protein